MWVDEVRWRVAATVEDSASFPAYLIRGPPLLHERGSSDEGKAVTGVNILDLDTGILRRRKRGEAWAR